MRSNLAALIIPLAILLGGGYVADTFLLTPSASPLRADASYELGGRADICSPVSARSAGPVPDFTLAVVTGNVPAIKLQIAAGASANWADAYGITPLMRATVYNKPLAVQELIATGADVNAKDRVGWTPIIDAVTAGNVACLRQLIAAGGNVNVVDVRGRTALSFVLPREDWNRAARITPSGGIVVQASVEPYPALDISDVHRRECVRLLLAHGGAIRY